MKMKTALLAIAFVVMMGNTLPLAAHDHLRPDPVHAPKLVNLKGTWFLRGVNECIPVVLDRKGRSEMLLGASEVYIDKTDDYLYLTTKKWPYTYTYRMNPLVWGTSYALELVTVGPANPAHAAAEAKSPFTGAYRTMVDCQLGVAAPEGGDSRVHEVTIPPGS